MHYLSSRVIFTSLFFFLTSVFLFHYSFVGQAVYGDGIYYYSYTRSLYKDFDINFRNELGHHYSPQNNNNIVEEPLGEVPNETKTSMIPNKYPIGAPLSWLNTFIIADSLSTLLNFFHISTSTIGYSDIYQISIGILNICFVVFGLMFLFQLLKDILPKTIVFITILTMLLGSNLLYYGSWDVINSHPLSFFISSIFFWLWYKTNNNRNITQWFLLGTLIGLLTITRTQDGIFLFIPILDLVLIKCGFSKKVKVLLVVIFGMILTVSPQIITWKILYGSFTTSPYIISGEGFNLLSPNIFGVLFNERTGLVFWCPIYLISFIGLFFINNRELKTKLIIFCLLQFYIISSWSGWTQGESFGIRMLISTIPFLTLGLGSIIQRVKKAKFAISMVIILYNIAAIIYFLAVVHAPTYDLGKNTKIEVHEKLYKLLNVKDYGHKD